MLVFKLLFKFLKCTVPLLLLANVDYTKRFSGWKPTHLTSVFALWTSVLPPDGTTLMALIRMLNTDVCRY